LQSRPLENPLVCNIRAKNPAAQLVVDPVMTNLLEALFLICALAAAIVLGKRFQAEALKARRLNKPWYAPYLSITGALMLLAISLPIILWLLRR